MPYISSKEIEYVDSHGPDNPGHLNYVLTKCIQFYVTKKGLSYKTINDVVGALEGCKLEFYRRCAAPYEDEKAKTNGDIYQKVENKIAVPSTTLFTSL